MNKEQDPEQVEPRLEAPSSTESDGIDNVTPELSNNKIDQDLADEYGWTAQRAKEARLYL